ncbi:iron-sulfur cluster assembly accessory protein [Aliidiomarina minuta]|uniref:Iron-sulfur cluster assembly accessory protein n=1 Tax=Aliidiomarina minuta TaxID=880057 RepID=A0A432W5V8_9GAMM|nr:iron-sulfur cluster assembly accessory protein [Aliidiomarina minuta]RUO25458.1 iron-sulfur cluster assembly accessory protein [Aliidiomarina minuta]
MSVETFVPQSAVISMTDTAVRYFEKKLSEQPGKIIRLGTKLSGCTGYAYVLDFADTAGDNDALVPVSDNLSIAVDKEALDVLRNTEIDYVKEGVNGIVKFNNPNVVDECGCGESFSVK